MSLLSTFRQTIGSHWLVFSAVLIVSLSFVNIWLTLYNNDIIDRTYVLQKQTEEAKLKTQTILYGTMHGLDLGVRGFGLTKDKNLLNPYEKAIKENHDVFANIRSIANLHHYGKLDDLEVLERKVDVYIQLSKDMVALVEKDSMETFENILRQDKGFDIWKRYVAFSEPFFLFEDQVKAKAQAEYQAAMRSNVLLQVVLIFIIMPTLGYIIYRIRKESRNGKALLLRMEKHNQTHLFYSGNEKAKTLTKDILEDSIVNIGKASQFVKQIAHGNYDAVWDGMDNSLIEMNRTTLAGELHRMKEQMQNAKEKEEKRNWVNEGLNQMGEVLQRTVEIDVLAENILNKLIKYLEANQGTLFVVNDAQADASYLELKAAYAYNRKKHLEKHIELGEGLAGQAWQEGETICLTEIPQDYIRITSGLGDAPPTNLLIVPLKHEQKVQGVLELASFKVFASHQISFVEKVAENIASVFSSAKIREHTSHLLSETQKMTETLRSQEEEMRQNMEEMIATQEEMARKEQEYLQRIAELETGRVIAD